MASDGSATVDERREDLQKLLSPYSDMITQVRRAYLDKASYALNGKHETEFEIKKAIAERYSIPFRSVLFAGSAQLGFSPSKDTSFVPGNSDLDVACVDSKLYQFFWEAIVRASRAFNDNSAFYPGHQVKLQDGILRRGMILLDYLPKSLERKEEQAFFDKLGSMYREHFRRISVAVYMSEYAFCWKQSSAIELCLGLRDAKRS